MRQCAFSGFTIAKTSTSKTGSESGTRLGDATHATQLLINEMANTARSLMRTGPAASRALSDKRATSHAPSNRERRSLRTNLFTNSTRYCPAYEKETSYLVEDYRAKQRPIPTPTSGEA